MTSRAIISTLVLLSEFAAVGAWSGAFLRPRTDNGLAKTPPMGWNSYNHYACVPNETIILSNAQAMVDLGLDKLGYHYVTTDCGWTIDHRLENGTLTWNSSLFPSSFPAMGDKIHELGLGFGVYSDAGIQMCMNGLPNQTGSLGHETIDAETFASWGADLLKYDNCYSSAEHGYPDADYDPVSPISPRMDTMSQALRATNRSILYAVCEWGVDFPSAWAPAIGNTWRITNDIIPAWRTIARIINQAAPQTGYAGPGQWLDLDMLEVGNQVFSETEEQTHMSLWSVIKSPLIIGAALKDNITSISESSLAIYSNKDVISYNQDSLGIAANFTRRWTEDEYEVWSGPLSGNRVVAALVNWRNESRELTLDLPVIGLQAADSVKSVWKNGSNATDVLTSYTESVPAHGTMLLELTAGHPEGRYESAWASVSGNTTVFKNVYGVTSSAEYALTITFGKSDKKNESPKVSVSSSSDSHRSDWHHHVVQSSTITVPLQLQATNNNTVTLISSLSPPIESIQISPPRGTYYPSTSFTLVGSANRSICCTDLCKPVGSKIGNISPTGGASIAIPANLSTYSTSGLRYVEIDFTNNDIALATSWTNGTNTRNLTVSVNGHITRIEVPLSGRSSELFSCGKGWDDSARFGVLLDGFGQGNSTEDEIIVSNVGGDEGIQPQGAEFVGMRIL